MTTLCLDFLTALEASPAELATIASRNQVPYISLLVRPGSEYHPDHRLIGDTAERRAARRACDDLGVGVDMIECFRLSPEVVVDEFEPALESGAALGAKRINILAPDEDAGRLRDNLGRVCEMAARHGLEVVCEVSRRQHFKRLGEAEAFLSGLGAGAPRILLDTLHFCRFGGMPDEVQRHRSWIGRVQLADGPAGVPAEEQWAEAIGERLPPGRGAFPLAEIVGAVPGEVVIGIEVPMDRLKNQGMPAAQRAQIAISATRELLGRMAANAP